MFRLTSLHVKNFCTLRDICLNVPASGLIYVTGESADTGEISSVGAGKTSIGEALSRALLGVTGRESRLGDYVSDDAGKGLYVKVISVLDGKELIVEHGFKHKGLSDTGEGLSFRFDGATTSRDRLAATRDELSKLIGLTPELASWTVFVDGAKLDFNEMSHRSSVELLMTALKQPPWDSYYDSTKLHADSFKSETDAARGSVDTIKRSIAELESSIDGAEQAVETARRNLAQSIANKEAQIVEKRTRIETQLRPRFDSLVEQKATNQARANTIKADMRVLEETAAVAAKVADEARAKVVEKIAKAQREADALQFKLNAAKDKAREAKTAEDKLRRNLKALSSRDKLPSTCPTCKKPWDNSAKQAHADAEVAAAEAEVTKAEKLTDDANQLVIEHQALYDTANTEVERLCDERDAVKSETSGAKVRQLSQEYSALEQGMKRTEVLIESARKSVTEAELELAKFEASKPDDSAVVRAEAALAAKLLSLDTERKKLSEASAEFSSAEEALKAVQYWAEAFSPAGIPNQVLRTAVEPLNEISRRISAMMTDCQIAVTYSTKKQLASGKERNELIISVDNKRGARRVEMSSKGERAVVNLIIAETLAELGGVAHRAGYRWLDEVTGNLEPSMRRSFFRYLKEASARQQIPIFICDHHSECADYADHILTVRKTGKTSTIELKSV